MSSSSAKKLILIDGSSYLFRAYHALPPLTNSKGKPTGAIYGVINMIKKLMGSHPFDYIGVVFDPKGKTFRHQLYPEYKANRTKMPDELRDQIAPLFELIKALGLPLIIHDGVEADDVIGTLAKLAEKHNIQTLISTMDKDMAQLVNENITLINTMSDRLYDSAAVKEKFGVHPHQMIDYLTMVGDSSDNVPGIPKVGEKTAAKWLALYGSLENVIQRADEITGKVGENLRNHLPHIPLARELVTILCDVKLPIDMTSLIVQKPQNDAVRSCYAELEFTRWLKELSSQPDIAMTEKPASTYRTIQTEKAFQALLITLAEARSFSFDTETTHLDVMQADLVGMSFCVEKNDAVYIPLKHKTDETQLSSEYVLTALKPLFADKQKIVIGQNLKYDYKLLKKVGIQIDALMEDTMLESYVLNSTVTRHNLDALAMKYLSRDVISFEDVAGKGAKQITFDYVPIDKATEYAAEDADVALQLHQTLMPLIEKDSAFESVLRDIEWPLMPVLANMEYHGVLIDSDMLKKQSADLSIRIIDIEKRVHALAGKSFNLGSPKQLQEILFDHMKLPVVKKTPTGAPSTDEGVMQELAMDYELAKLIVEFRQLSKLKSTYADALPALVNEKTGRVHTSYNQAITSTGRLSSNNPNLQNIPIRTEEGRKIRQAFIAPKNHKIISADYSQIELRIMAHLSKDPGLLSAFEKKQDIHAATAADVFGVDISDVTHDMRRSAKAINFGLLYGMSAFGLAKQLQVDRHEAQRYMDLYFSRFPGVKAYMQKTREFAEKNGYVETLLGRKLFVPDITASNKMRKMAAERAAINAPLQGTAADIIKLAMICVDRKIKELNLPMTMIMQVHDELIFEVPDTNVDTMREVITACMENALKIDVPLEIAMGVGDNWDEAH